MREKDENEMLCGILQAADRHPNSRVAKLIRCVEQERSQKNIVMLLMELADHAEYATDFNISLRYYLDLFEKLGVGRDIVLNEAGLLLLNSSKIYSRRVDYVHELVERQILTLTKTDRELAEAKNAEQSTVAAEKPKRGRKRLVEAPNDPYEIELIPKKFRKLSDDKRFHSNNSNKAKTKTLVQRLNEAEQHIHPAGWMHSSIVDFENEEEVDSKRNYKLFTYHVEHRYNTLVPDINFRLHFKVKDYIDEEQERMEKEHGDGGNCPAENTRVWPPLSEEYVDKYLSLENQILEQEIRPLGKILRISARNEESIPSTDDHAITTQEMDTTILNSSNALQNDSALGSSFLSNTNNSNNDDSTTTNLGRVSQSMQHTNNKDYGENTVLANVQNSNLECTQTENLSNESGLGISLLDSSDSHENIGAEINLEKSLNNTLSIQNDSALGESMTEVSIDLKEMTATLDDNEITLELNNQTSTKEAESVAVQNGGVKETLGEGETNNTVSMQDEAMLEQNITTTADKNDENILNSSKADSIPDCGFNSINHTDEDPHRLDVAKRKGLKDSTQINLEEIRVLLPHLDDEGVFFSDLDEQDHLLLSPTVMATDVFPAIPNKKGFTIIVDDEIKALLNLPDDEPETYQLPLEKRPLATPITLNIFKIHEKILRKRVLFKLGPEMELYLRARSLKRPRTAEVSEKRREYKMFKWFSLKDTDMSGVNFTPNATPNHESEFDFAGFSDVDSDDGNSKDFLGFNENELLQALDSNIDTNHRLSRDSGVGVDVPVTPIKEKNLEAIMEERCDVEQTIKATKHLDGCVKDLFSAANENIDNASDTLKNTGETINETEHATNAEVSIKNTEEYNLNDKSINDAHEPENSENTFADSNQKSVLENSDCAIANNKTAQSDNNDEAVENDTDDFLPQNNDADLNNRRNFAVLEEKLDDSLEEIELVSSKTKIQKWHEHLQPILAKSRERHHFDIFQIGTEIIDSLQTKNADVSEDDEMTNASAKCITFQDIMHDKDPTFVSRYFLSSLLLANQSNVKINVQNQNSEKPSEWSDIQFELLSTKRHTVAIEDNIGIINNKVHQKAGTKTVNKRKCSQIQKFPTTTISNNDMNESAGADTSQAMYLTACDTNVLNVNLNIVKPLKQIEKLPHNSDDYDSGIFSNEEITLS